jgi:hypothetical protein
MKARQAPLAKGARRASPVAAAGRHGEVWIDLITRGLPPSQLNVAAVQRKLTVRNRGEIAAWAWRTGIVTE